MTSPTETAVATIDPPETDLPVPAKAGPLDGRVVELMRKKYGFKKMPVTELLELRELGVGLHGLGITKTRVGVFVSQQRMEEILTELHGLFIKARSQKSKLKITTFINQCELRLNQIRQTSIEIDGVRRDAGNKPRPTEPTAKSFPPMVPVQIIAGKGAKVQVMENPLAPAGNQA